MILDAIASSIVAKQVFDSQTSQKTTPLIEICTPNNISERMEKNEQSSKKIAVKANDVLLAVNAAEPNGGSDVKARKLNHPRIKYSGVKVADKSSTPCDLTPKHIEKANDETNKRMELSSPLNIDKLFPHVMSGGASFAQNPQLARTISGEADDMASYADIDDIELPDGSKIGYPTDLKRFSNALTIIPNLAAQTTPIMPIPSHNLAMTFGRIDPEPWMFNQSGNIPSTAITGSSSTQPTTKKESFQSSLTRLSFSSDTCDFPVGTSAIGSGGGNGDDSLEIYACRHCGKTYRWKSTLRRHENDECGDKKPAHECPYCPYKAKQRGNLGVHVRKHHFNQPQLETRRKRRSSFERKEKVARGVPIGNK